MSQAEAWTTRWDLKDEPAVITFVETVQKHIFVHTFDNSKWRSNWCLSHNPWTGWAELSAALRSVQEVNAWEGHSCEPGHAHRKTGEEVVDMSH